MKTQHTYTLEEATAIIAKLTKVKPSQVNIENDLIPLTITVFVLFLFIFTDLFWNFI